MKSVKPGRGPSLLGGAASVIAAVIGVAWIAVAASMDAPVYFCLFGVVFVGLAIAQALYDLYNASAKRRFSLFDVTEEGEEPDPLAHGDGSGGAEAFCPACGAKVAADDLPRTCPRCETTVPAGESVCPRCGKRVRAGKTRETDAGT